MLGRAHTLVNFNDMQSTSKKMLDDIRQIRQSLDTNFSDGIDGYTRQMFRFSAAAEADMQDLREGIVQAGKSLRDVQAYFGEGEEMGRPLQSQEFFGIYSKFTSSYKVCRAVDTANASTAGLRTGPEKKKRSNENDAKPERRSLHRSLETPTKTSWPIPFSDSRKVHHASSGKSARQHLPWTYFPRRSTILASACLRSAKMDRMWTMVDSLRA